MKQDVEDTFSAAIRERAESKSILGKSDAERQEMQKRMEAACTPGPAHKALDWVLNGRFLEEEFHGEMMGKAFTGRSLMGYDNIKGTFSTVWVSDMQTSISTSEGKGENGNKVITLEGNSNCPATGRKDIPMKTVFRVISPDKHILEMFNDGAKTMEITYTRK
jgi:hypothetical protein